jgi:ribose 5-phosphate isomerase A
MSTEEGTSRHAQLHELKRSAAETAAAELRSGMVVGLGSGSTASLAVDAIGARVRAGLKVIAIPTSERTAAQARGLGIPLTTLGEYPVIDVTVDGADEVEFGTLNLIKGGGGNHLREKIVANATSRLVIAIDESKLVSRLGHCTKVPVEVAQFGWQATGRGLQKLKASPTLRESADGQPFVTDGGNYILDCASTGSNQPTF